MLVLCGYVALDDVVGCFKCADFVLDLRLLLVDGVTLCLVLLRWIGLLSDCLIG